MNSLNHGGTGMSNFFERLDLLDSLETINLKAAEKKIIQVLGSHDTLTRAELQTLSGVPERSLRRYLNNLVTRGILNTCRSGIRIVELNPVLLDIFTLTGRVGYDFEVVMNTYAAQNIHGSTGPSVGPRHAVRTKSELVNYIGRNSLNTTIMRS